jgi:myo-inositol-1(or 4)-monophosphatase
MNFNPEFWLAPLIEIAQEICQHPKRRFPTRKSDGSWVTEADTISDKKIMELANQLGIGYLGEELVADFLTDMKWNQTMLIVDPIDGTAPYCNGLPFWGISIGFVANSRFQDGLLFLPEMSLLIWSNESEIWSYQGAWTSLTHDILLKNANKLGQPVQPQEHGMVAISQAISKRGKFQCQRYVLATASSVYALSQLILGSCVGYISSGCVWDFAGALPILSQLGFKGKFYHGNWFDLKNVWEIFTQDQNLVAQHNLILGSTQEIVLEIESASIIQ